MMLEDYGVRGVRITCIEGQLTDHYNPESNTVNLVKTYITDQHNGCFGGCP